MSLKRLQTGVQDRLQGLMDRASGSQGFMLRVIYPRYQKAQLKRWMTEGPGWPPLTARYAAQKRVRFAAYPGSGRKMLIATDRLRQSVVGPHRDFRMHTTRTSMVISTAVPYAGWVDERRDFTTFDRATVQQWRDDLMEYVLGRSVR